MRAGVDIIAKLRNSTALQPLEWHITKLKFNEGTEIAIGKSDIVVFVGPNNAGKSRSLHDIFDLCGTIAKGIVIESVDTEVTPCDDIEHWLKTLCKTRAIYSGHVVYSFLGADIGTTAYELFVQKHFHAQDTFRKLLFSNLKTEERLTVVAPPPLLDPEEPRSHPIQILKDNKAKANQVSSYFERAFGERLCVRVDTKTIALLLGSTDEDASFEAIKKAQQNMPQLHEQGDGMRSFAGIVLNLSMPNYTAFFIDEPESFLHPPQARILGEILPEAIPAGKQAFIATHSQELLKGLIEKNPHRVKIIRITRQGNTNGIKLLDNKEIAEAWKDSLVKYSNLLDALFHRAVVVCESDSDCKVYSMVLSDTADSEAEAANVLFSYCGGKHRFATVAKILKALGVEFRIVADLDFLNSEELVKEVFETCGGKWEEIRTDYNVVKSGVSGLDKKYTVGDLKATCDGYFAANADHDKELKKADVEVLKSSLKYPKGWDMVKHNGAAAIPNGDPTTSFARLAASLRQKGIFMPEVGELENFIKSIPGHGPKWAEEAIIKYPTLSDNDKRPLREFVASLFNS